MVSDTVPTILGAMRYLGIIAPPAARRAAMDELDRAWLDLSHHLNGPRLGPGGESTVEVVVAAIRDARADRAA